MSAAATLARLRERGVGVELIHGHVKVVGASKAAPGDVEAARALKAEIVVLLQAEAAPEVRRCSCGAAAHFGEGWSLRGRGGERWYCQTCRPSREDVVDVAGGVGVAGSPTAHEEARLDWWRQPVEGWAEGRLLITNVLTGVETIIDLRGGR